MMLRRRMPIYDPANDPRIFAWWDASDQSTIKGVSDSPIVDGGTVYQFIDKIGGRTFGNSSTSWLPVWQEDAESGRPHIYFNGSKRLSLASSSHRTGLQNLTALTVIVVASVDSTSSSFQYFLEIMTGGSGNAGRVYLLATNYASSYQVGGRRLDSDSARGYNVTPVTVGKPVVLTGVYRWGEAKIDVHLNGIRTVYGQPFQTAGATSDTMPKGVHLGAASTAYNLNGKIHEVIWMNGALTPSELVGPHHYLRTKWRIEPSPSSGGMGLMMEFGGESSPILNCESCEEPLNEAGMCDSCYFNEEM